jgi:hypothetical protein
MVFVLQNPKVKPKRFEKLKNEVNGNKNFFDEF